MNPHVNGVFENSEEGDAQSGTYVLLANTRTQTPIGELAVVCVCVCVCVCVILPSKMVVSSHNILAGNDITFKA